MCRCIKVCVTDTCEAVFHNVPDIPTKHTKCLDCGGRTMKINRKTWEKKFNLNWFQYDYLTHELWRPPTEEEE